MKATPESLYALAWRLEEHGQYNNAGMLRAAAEALLRRAAADLALTKDHAVLAEMLARTAEELQQNELTGALGKRLVVGAEAMARNELPLYDAAPAAYVCRSCGEIGTGDADRLCPNCGYHNGTRKHFPPVYWLTHFDPVAGLESLKNTPQQIRDLIEGYDEAQLTSAPGENEWSFRKTLSHIVDAQDLLAFRLGLLIEQHEPMLEAQAVFLFEEKEDGVSPTTRVVFDRYAESRQRVVETLEGLPLRDWWRRGFHQEFGWVTIGQQVSYFATHEMTHVQQLRGALPMR